MYFLKNKLVIFLFYWMFGTGLSSQKCYGNGQTVTSFKIFQTKGLPPG